MKNACGTFLIFLLLAAPVQATERWEYFVPGNDVQDIACRGDYVWCATTCGVVRWDRRDMSYVKYNQSPDSHRITADPSGNVWVGYKEAGTIRRFDGTAWTDHSLPGKGIHVRSLFPAGSGDIWCATGEQGAFRYDGGSWTQYPPADSLARVYDVAADPDGALWFVTHKGAWRWDGDLWRLYTTADGLVDSVVNCVTVDRAGVKWFGTNRGLSRYDGKTWRTFTRQDGLPDLMVTDSAADGAGNVWFATGGGMARWDGSVMSAWKSSEGLLSDAVKTCAVDRKGRVWCGHGNVSKGVSVYENGKWRGEPFPLNGLSGAEVFSSACDSSGVMWFALDRGVASLADGVWRLYGASDGLGGEYVRNIFADRAGRVWFMLVSGGVTGYDGRSWSTFTSSDGLCTDTVTAMGQGADGTLFACTTGGVCRSSGGRWEYVPDRDRLMSPTVHGMAEDRSGRMWFATGRGLSRFDGSVWRTWTVQDGLPGNDVPAVACSPDGNVWCISGGMLCRFDGERFTVFPGPPSGGKFDDHCFEGPLVMDASGEIWACAGGTLMTGMGTYRSGGLWRFHEGDWAQFPLGFGEEYLVQALCADKRGAIWYGTTLGLVRWDGRERSLHRVNAPDHPYASQIVTDHAGSVWLNGGSSAAVLYVSRYDGKTWRMFAPGAEPAISNSSIQVDSKDRKWFSGARCLEGDSLRTVIPLTELPDYGQYGFLVEGDGSSLWFGSRDRGLFRWRGGNWMNLTVADGLPSNAIAPVTFGPDGTLWCSMTDSVAWFDGRTWKTHPVSISATSIAFGKRGTVWIGTGKGLLRYEGEEWTEFFALEGNSRMYVRSISVDDAGVVWAVPWDDGVLRYDGMLWKRYTTADGLLSNRVFAVGVDSRNRKWFSTEDGYCVLDDSAPEAVSGSAPAPVALLGNYPNPFNASTAITFSLPESGKVTLTVYDVTGREVRTLFSGTLPAGRSAVRWDGRDDSGREVSSGVYLARLSFGKSIATGRMTLVK